MNHFKSQNNKSEENNLLTQQVKKNKDKVYFVLFKIIICPFLMLYLL